MSEKVLEGLNKIIVFFGLHGGISEIETDWDFHCNVCDFGDGDYELEIYSESEDGILKDPLFRIEIEFDDTRTKILSYRPLEYLSMYGLGEMRIDASDNIVDNMGNVDYAEGDLEERLESYIDTVTGFYPYLTEPKSFTKYKEDVDYTRMAGDNKKLRREAITRMRMLGIDESDVIQFANGEYTKVYVDHENKSVKKMIPTSEEIEMLKKAEQDGRIPFVAYYIISDVVTYPDGTTETRYILPYVWDEKYDATSEDEEADAWGEVRRYMLRNKIIQCYTINADTPEFSEFGELPYRMIDGMLFVVG